MSHDSEYKPLRNVPFGVTIMHAAISIAIAAALILTMGHFGMDFKLICLAIGYTVSLLTLNTIRNVWG